MPPKNPPPGGEGGAGELPEKPPREKVETEEDDGRDIFARAAGDEDDGDDRAAGKQWAMHAGEAGEGRPDPRFKYDESYLQQQQQHQPQSGGPMDPSSRHSFIDLTCLSPPPLNPAPPGSFPTFSREQQQEPLTAEGDAVEDEGHHRRKMDRGGRGWPPYFPSSEDSGKTDDAAAWGRDTGQGDTGEDYDIGQTLSGNPHRSGHLFSPLRSFSNANLTSATTSHPNLPTTHEQPAEVPLPRNNSYESLHEID